MIYELRTYIIPAGRMDDILDRFRSRTLGIFARHGFDLVGFWTVDDPQEGELVYLLRWASQEASTAAWAAFREDEEWLETRRITEADGAIVDQVIEKSMIATDFSPMT
ncbi:MAG: NIPSNAP family protein [Gemmatimonadetes bacterium]|jgi:heme-degrading monooxygenase HmoA|nr:NIPSNAP family protein [Gemmatimonadota bacterium]MBT5142211.1 NIPSNAP family protein [Gemmatimonadota bacterium]MBT5589204.1 NIPSNAP family protein [Gemmatimonadota bacterium]MBT5963146.1 NIPSNAP family protein [Gemmatimonadota bacterium]MBT6627388.1 NIPSNAP family protein [Gemmatimonadota bacterium]